MFDTLIRRGRRALLALSATAIAGLVLSGCGGSGAGAQGSTPAADSGMGGPQGGVAVKLVGTPLQVDPRNLKPVDVTAVVTDPNGLAVSGAEVAFAITDPAGAAGGAALEVSRRTTDATGTAVARLTLSGAQVAREIVVKASARSVAAEPMTVTVLSPTMNLRLASSETLVDAAAPTSVTLSAIVTNDSAVAVAGVPVEFTLTDPAGAAGGASIAVTQGTTDDTGTATAKLNLSGTQTARDLVVTSRALGVTSQPRTIRVTRAVVSASGPATLALNGATFTDYTVTVLDLQGQPLAGTTVAVASAAGNQLSATNVTTDGSGRAVVGVRGRTVGVDTLSFGALGVTYPLSVTVGGSIRLIADRVILDSDRKTPVLLSAVVTDTNNVAIQDAQVAFSVTDPTGQPGAVRVEVLEAATNASGIATARLVLQGDRTERTLTANAQVGGSPPAAVSVQVGGSTISVTGPAYVPLNTAEPTLFNAVLRDSSGTPIAGQLVQARSVTGNVLSTSAATTDASGRAVFGVRGTVAGSDKIRVTALGLPEQEASFSVSSFRLSISPATGFTTVVDPVTLQPRERRTVAIGPTGGTVRVDYEAAGGVPPGTQVRLTSTRGTVTPADTALDISSGSATFGVASTFVGPATVTAIVGGATASYEFDFVSTTPASLDLQPSPSVIGANTPGATTQRSTLTAVVRDASGNPVAGQAVTFTAAQDPSGGSIVPGVSVTDSAGRATADFIAGPTSTAPNGVTVRATVTGVAPRTSTLTVSRAALFVRIGTDNTVEKIDPVLYRKTYAAIVTDASGNPVAGATVQASLRPTRYATGRWVKVTGATPPWSQQVDDRLGNEDLNYDGVCSAGEDLNTDGQLTPGNVASADAAQQTDANGAATVRFQYPREFAAWTEVILEVRASVAGSEGAASTEFWLPIAADDLNSESIPPPGAFSPFPFPTGPQIPRTCP